MDRTSRRRSRSRSPRPERRRSASPDRRDRKDRSYRRSRSRTRSRSPDSRRRSTYRSRASRSPSSRSEDSDASRRRRRKKEKGKDRDRDRDRDRSRDRSKRHSDKKRRRSRSRSRSRERRERKERKKEKKEKKAQKTAASTSQWGKYGVINESDLYNKEQEFRAWLIEEQMINPESLSKDAERKKFAQFVEDYNTASLPHEKYYALEPYERRMSMVRNGEMVPQGDEGGYDPMADLAAHSSGLKNKRPTQESESYLSRKQLEELRQVQLERNAIGKMKSMGLEIKGNLGVRMEFDT